MFTCDWCGRDVPPGQEFCPSCGHEYVETKTCKRCGSRMPIDGRLCSNCGAFMEVAVADGYPAGSIQGASAGPGPYGGQAVGAPAPSVPKPKELWMKGRGADPVYVGAIVLAVISAAFYWVPILGIILSCLTMAVAAFGYYRYYSARDMYEHLWINILATVIAFVVLIVAIRWTMRVERIAGLLLYFSSMC